MITHILTSKIAMTAWIGIGLALVLLATAGIAEVNGFNKPAKVVGYFAYVVGGLALLTFALDGIFEIWLVP
jgi:hypothetical protein